VATLAINVDLITGCHHLSGAARRVARRRVELTSAPSKVPARCVPLVPWVTLGNPDPASNDRGSVVQMDGADRRDLRW